MRSVPTRHPATQASAAYGRSNGQDMWIWMTHPVAAPIRPKASGTGIFPRRKTGTASKKPMKKAIDGTSRYEGLRMWAESCSVQGSVISQPQTSQAGSEGMRALMYHASAARAAMDIRLMNTYGASGIGAMRSGMPTSSACSAPGIWLSVQTTSAPK